MIPIVYQEIKDILPTSNEGEVPRTTERVLRKVESLSALMKNDNTKLPLDIIQAIFRSLYLRREEKKAMLPYLGQIVEVTISVIRLYITNRFWEYEMMSNALGPPPKNKEQKTPRLPNVEIAAGAATTSNRARDNRTSG